jgi:signal transduction histidine kinase
VDRYDSGARLQIQVLAGFELGRLLPYFMAQRTFTERAISAVVVIPAAIMVVTLAFLQYDWSSRVSEATNQRLADSLQMSMINWHLDFFRGFSQICLALGIDPDETAPTDLQQLAKSFVDWGGKAPYPDLVSGFYIIPADTSRHASALRFVPVVQRFAPVELPSQIASLQKELETIPPGSPVRGPGNRADAYGAPLDPSQTSGKTVERFYARGILMGWSFDPELPALVHPLFEPRSKAQTQEQERTPVEWIVLQLNSDVMRTHVLPDLTQRYFQGTDGLDFQVAVLAGTGTRSVIYSSDPGFGSQTVRDADGTMDLFGRVQDRSVGSPVHVFHKPSLNKGPAAAVGVSWFPLVVDVPADRDWQLIVQHRRGGPLGAFAGELRRRDLMISFGVLLLLVVSIAILMMTSYRAQRLAKLQMNFVTTISHELRTPLTVISTAADNIAHGVVDGKQQLMHYGSVIGAQARQLSELVEQVLLFAAGRDGRLRYRSSLVMVSDIIELALANTSELVHAAQFTVERNIDSGLPPVIGDPFALSQCLQNLITNALKYGAESRWIGVRASCEENGALGRTIQISISDRGTGIAPSDMPHIFEPFYRSPLVAGTQIHGTGLGLPLAKSIAEAMNGDLTVRSIPGEGSTFTLHLPVAVASTDSSQVQSAPAVVQR